MDDFKNAKHRLIYTYFVVLDEKLSKCNKFAAIKNEYILT